MVELEKIEILYPEYEAKNLFVRDDKKQNYYLISVKGDKKVDLKEFKKKYGTRTLTFASNEDLMEYLKLTPGSVTPLGLLNDDRKIVHFYLDKEFLNDKAIIGIHPNDNTATIWMAVHDLIRIIEEQGNCVSLFKVL